MGTDSGSGLELERKQRAAGILKSLCVVVLIVLFFVLAESMVHHRFFRGGRVHLNGSIGQ
jgi:hypothetical protein